MQYAFGCRRQRLLRSPAAGTSKCASFPLAPGAAVSQDTQADFRPPAGDLDPAGRDSDELFAELADEDHITRYTAAQLIGETALDDPRAVPALLDRLERDPSQPVRLMAARGLRFWQGRPPSVRHYSKPPRWTKTSRSAGKPATRSGSPAVPVLIRHEVASPAIDAPGVAVHPGRNQGRRTRAAQRPGTKNAAFPVVHTTRRHRPAGMLDPRAPSLHRPDLVDTLYSGPAGNSVGKMIISLLTRT